MGQFKHLWTQVRDYGLIAAGALVQALGLRLFLVPAHLASGGVSGISQLINHYTGWPIGGMVFLDTLYLQLTVGLSAIVVGTACQLFWLWVRSRKVLRSLQVPLPANRSA